MPIVNTHQLSHAWLRDLAAQNSRIEAHPEHVRSAVRAMRKPTDAYLEAKQARSSGERDACLQRLMALAAPRGLGAMAAQVCEPRLSAPMRGPGMAPQSFCPDQALYQAVLEFVTRTGAAGKQARDALRFLAALAHPDATESVRAQLHRQRGCSAPIVRLPGAEATLYPDARGVGALIQAFDAHALPCVRQAYDAMSFGNDPTLMHGIIAALDTLPLGACLVAVMSSLCREAIGQEDNAATTTLSRALANMRIAERRGETVLALAHRAEFLNEGLRAGSITESIIDYLAQPLHDGLVAYLDDVEGMRDEAQWAHAVRAMRAVSHLADLAPCLGPGLDPVCYWTPNLAAIDLYRTLLLDCPAAYERAAADALRFLMRMQGPARDLWPTDETYQFKAMPAGHADCMCPDQKTHVEQSITNPGKKMLVRFDNSVQTMVHGEFVPRVGAFLRNAAEGIFAGLQRIYDADCEAQSWDNLIFMFEVWKGEACIDGKLQTINEFLEANALDPGDGAAQALDLTGKTTDNDKVSEYLRVFRAQARAAYARDYNLETGTIHARNLAAIEGTPTFVSTYCNDRLFAAHLRSTPHYAAVSAAQLEALIDYQVEKLSLLERAKER